jgi:glycosyltransferase involved in cell wall biosynthesis
MTRLQVTALLPIKNGEKYVNRIMANVIECTNSGDEILVINDHSTDSTAQLLSKWESRYSRIKVINPEKSGLVNALNLGVEQAKNEWIARFDCDDMYRSDRLDQQISIIGPRVVGIFSDYLIVDGDGRNLGLMPSPISSTATRLSLWRNARTAHPSVIFHRDSVIRVGGYIESDFLAEDLSLWLRLSKVGELKSVPETLINYTLNPNSITGTRYEESKVKAREIYSKKGLDLDLLRNAIQGFDSQLEIYSRYSLKHERTMHHYLDVVANSIIMKLPKRELLPFLVSNLKFNYLVYGLKFISKKLARKFLRKINPKG